MLPRVISHFYEKIISGSSVFWLELELKDESWKTC